MGQPPKGIVDASWGAGDADRLKQLANHLQSIGDTAIEDRKGLKNDQVKRLFPGFERFSIKFFNDRLAEWHAQSIAEAVTDSVARNLFPHPAPSSTSSSSVFSNPTATREHVGIAAPTENPSIPKPPPTTSTSNAPRQPFGESTAHNLPSVAQPGSGEMQNFDLDDYETMARKRRREQDLYQLPSPSVHLSHPRPAVPERKYHEMPFAPTSTSSSLSAMPTSHLYTVSSFRSDGKLKFDIMATSLGRHVMMRFAGDDRRSVVLKYTRKMEKANKVGKEKEYDEADVRKMWDVPTGGRGNEEVVDRWEQGYSQLFKVYIPLGMRVSDTLQVHSIG
ncbi:hypothetical protein DFJ73DRAFT_927819 [Zopfochytrium polystomum]|nr:hypothetical protein DFJ73DRAFT_927819 [Zopfochytrium polystomum]